MSSSSETGEPSSQTTLPESDIQMTIWEHLSELRSRLFRAAIALVICAGTCWAFREKLLHWIIGPYENAWITRGLPGKLELQTLGPADVFVGYLQLSLIGGAVCAAPIIFYQLWSFISPGLYRKEKRLIVPFVLSSSLLFGSGVAFGYYIALPFTFNYFLSLTGVVTENGTMVSQRLTLEFYLDFATHLLVAFGIVFELPIFIAFLVIGRIVTPKQLVKFSRWAVLIAFIVGAIVTPGPEISSQIAVAGALVALYFLSLGLAFILKPRDLAEEESPPPPPSTPS